MVKISVAMITCNGARWVAGQATSIAAQDRKPDEVIVADDASNDDTVNLALEALSDLGDRTRVLAGGSRLGVTANLERALHASSGDVVVLADQDDTWLPNKLAMVEQWATTSGAGAMFSDGWIIDASGQRTGERLWPRAGFTTRLQRRWDVDALGVLLKQPVVTGATMALRRSAVTPMLPLPTKGWHDYSMSLMLAATSGIDRSEGPLIEYRLHGGNAAGLRPLNRRERLLDRDAHQANLAMQIAQLEAVVEWLADREASLEVDRLQAKIAVLRRRAELPRRRPLRLRDVAALAAGGHYRRFGQGLSSAARDLLWP